MARAEEVVQRWRGQELDQEVKMALLPGDHGGLGVWVWTAAAPQLHFVPPMQPWPGWGWECTGTVVWEPAPLCTPFLLFLKPRSQAGLSRLTPQRPLRGGTSWMCTPLREHDVPTWARASPYAPQQLPPSAPKSWDAGHARMDKRQEN